MDRQAQTATIISERLVIAITTATTVPTVAAIMFSENKNIAGKVIAESTAYGM